VLALRLYKVKALLVLRLYQRISETASTACLRFEVERERERERESLVCVSFCLSRCVCVCVREREVWDLLISRVY
jgi:hypothetical protein